MNLKKLLDEIRRLKEVNLYGESLKLQGIKETVEADNVLIDLIEDVILAKDESQRVNALFELKKVYVETLNIRQQIKEELK